jgi:hypothetical protein
MTPPANQNPNQNQNGKPAAGAQPLIDLSRLNRVLEQFKGRKGALSPILQRTQDIYGYLPKGPSPTSPGRRGFP